MHRATDKNLSLLSETLFYCTRDKGQTLNLDYLGYVPLIGAWTLTEKKTDWKSPYITSPTQVAPQFFWCLEVDGHWSTTLCTLVPDSQVILAGISRLVFQIHSYSCPISKII